MENAENGNRKPVKKSTLKKIITRIGLTVVVIFFLGFLAFKLSPWPSALLIRYFFDKEGAKVEEALKKHVPPGIAAMPDQQYDLKDKDAFLDVYYPAAISGTDQALPVIVWIHGGGWVAGSKEGIANYCKILAGKGYTVVSVDYSLAPGKHYPTPLRQVNNALAYLQENAKRLHINPSHFIIAGDSGGASIAAQVANIISNNSYAQLLDIAPAISRQQLSGLILYCGPYDTTLTDFNGKNSSFLKSILWAYSGKKDFANDKFFNTLSVINYVNNNFPPSFISVGNGDPLKIHSEALARKLTTLNVKTDTLFYAPGHIPDLPHEYQFNLDTDAGKTALEKSVLFLSNLNMTGNKGHQ